MITVDMIVKGIPFSDLSSKHSLIAVTMFFSASKDVLYPTSNTILP